MSELTIGRIAQLSNNGRIYVDAGGRGQIETKLTTSALKELTDELADLRKKLAAARSVLNGTVNLHDDPECAKPPAVTKCRGLLMDSIKKALAIIDGDPK